MQSLAKKPNVLFLIAVRSCSTVKITRFVTYGDHEFTYTYYNLRRFMLKISLCIRGFGRKFLKKYVNAHIRKYIHIVNKWDLNWKYTACEFIKEWRVNGQLHRHKKPALKTHMAANKQPLVANLLVKSVFNGASYPENYMVRGERWYKNGIIHRKKDPAQILHIIDNKGIRTSSNKWFWKGNPSSENHQHMKSWLGAVCADPIPQIICWSSVCCIACLAGLSYY